MDQRIQHQLLHRLKPTKGIIIMRRQKGEISTAPITLNHHWGGKAAIK